MKAQTRTGIFLIIFFCLCILYVIITSQRQAAKQDERYHKQMALIGKIRFKGEIIGKKIYRYAGKDYHLICIKLDYSNTADVYMYNDLCGLKIKNGIATFSAGVYDSALGEPKYIEVNMNSDNKVKTIFKDGSSEVDICTLDPYGLSEKDLNTCN